MLIKSDSLIKNPLVSVIIPSYNRVDTIEDTLNGVLSQKCAFDYEIIIGDDFSSQETRFLLKKYQEKYPDKIQLLFQEQNIGLAANWAHCVKLARGKYVANCDNDDYWHLPEKLQLQVDFLEQNDDYSLVHTDYRAINSSTSKVEEQIIHDLKYEDSLLRTIFYTDKFRCCNSSTLFRKSDLLKYVKLDDYIKYQFTLQDWNTWLFLAKHTKFHCLPVVSTTVRWNNESVIRPVDYEKLRKRMSEEKKLNKYMCDAFPDDLVYDEKKYDAYINRTFLSLAYRKRDYKTAREYAGKLWESGRKNIKIFCALNPFLFYAFYGMKNLKRQAIK